MHRPIACLKHSNKIDENSGGWIGIDMARSDNRAISHSTQSLFDHSSTTGHAIHSLRRSTLFSSLDQWIIIIGNGVSELLSCPLHSCLE